VDTNLKPHEEQQQQQHEQQQQPPIPRGTALYASPEVLRASSPFGFTAAVDHWSVGCILHAMVHGKSPFDRGSESLTVRAIFGYCGGAGGTAKDEGPAGSALATGERLEAETIPDEIDEELAFTTERNTKTEEADEQDLLQLLSQELLAVIPEERISAWKNGARSFLSSKSQDVDGNCKDGGSDQPDEIESQSSVAASAGKNVLLPVPEWQEQVANATLRDGSLGWLVFEV
jgi:serine/threonine protein kinase